MAGQQKGEGEMKNGQGRNGEDGCPQKRKEDAEGEEDNGG